MRRLRFSPSLSSNRLDTPRIPCTVMGVAILFCLCVSALAACSQPSILPPDTSPLPTATSAPMLIPQLTPTVKPTFAIPTTVAPTPIPTVPPRASTIILQLTISPADTQVPYDRGEWKHWIDSDDDCQDARHEVLVSEATVAIEFKDREQCEVATGSWTDPYTREILTNPGDLDIDHMVPLINAHKSGGYAWDRNRKREYANDLTYAGHLIAVSASANRSKGGKGPDEWRPPNTEYWCQYALDWVTIKWEWELTATEPEASALSEMLDTCETRIYLQTIRREDADEDTPTPTATSLPQASPPTETPAPMSPPRTTSPTETPTQVPVLTPTPTPMSVDFPKPLPDHNCSDFYTWSEAQAFFEAQGGPSSDPHQLDHDGNGIACQTLPGAPGSSITPEPSHTHIALLTTTCSDFSTWDRAQAFFVSHGGPELDPHGLDTDGNGIPCQSLIGAPTPTPTITPTPTPIQDRNCSDFDTWLEAQVFFESEGGPVSDPHRLDRDGDGVACQSLSGAPSGASSSRAADSHNCSDFDTWSEAQSFYESEGGPGSDPHRLDRDGDGIACQSIPGAPGSNSTSDSSAEPTPTPAAIPTAQTVGETPTPESEDTHNCSDFDTWTEAQSFFESEGGPGSDPHHLDGNDDGIACESLPGAPGKPTPASAAPKSTGTPPSETFQDKNCSDFSIWTEAQSFYESEGGPSSDPHRLDGDGDGIACQSLPGAPGKPAPSTTPASAPPTPTSEPTPNVDTHNCSDFATQPEAQAFFESEGGPASDPHRLDRDGDGVACQSLPGAPKSTSKSEDTHNCSDFSTWSEAQSFYESEGGPDSDPHKLDRDRDGIACVSLPGAPRTPTPTPTSTSG